MLRGILVGLDGSPFSDAAKNLSIRWAKECGAELGGLGIIDEPTIRKPTGLAIGAGHYKAIADEQRLADARDKVAKFLSDFSQQCQDASISYRRLQDVGVPAEQILREAQCFDLIMLGRQSYFQFETQEGPDATLHQVLHSTPRPVVTVPRDLTDGRSSVVAYDGSVQAARALQAFLHSGLSRNRPVHVVGVGEVRQAVEEMVRPAADFLSLHEVECQIHPIVSQKEPGPILLEEAPRLDAGLLIMGAYGKPTIRNFFFGSATKAVLKKTTIPVFLYH